MKHWRILSNGPSIAALTELPGKGPIVAVNHAITHPYIEADCWCVHEYGRGIENDLVLVAKGPKEETWVGRGHVSRWERNTEARHQLGLRRLKLVPHPQVDVYWRQLLPWKTVVRWGTYTFAAAVANCIVRGAESVVCHGVDHDGLYNYGQIPSTARVRENNDRALGFLKPGRGRWAFESEQLKLIQEECLEHGIEVTRA